ncbi:MAG: MerR family transcriptional regulator [Anaerolineales bacterium]
MFKIGEFSQIAQVSVRMLRHYDKLGLLQPSRVDTFTGYRYYLLDQLPRLNRILALKDLGFSLEQIRDLLEKDLPPDQLQGMLLWQEAQIEQTLAEEQARLQRVRARLEWLQNDHPLPAYDVVLKTSQAQHLIAAQQVVPTLADMKAYRCGMFDDVWRQMEACGVLPNGPEVVLYHLQEYHETDIDMELGLPVADAVALELQPRLHPGLGISCLPGDEPLATTVHRGPIWELPQTISALLIWINTNGYQVAGSTREQHLSGREHENPEADPVVFEIQIPIIA